ncbi:MAG: polyprenyl synthetase family protein [Clostridia bacterium]|nr:polyprenyl synthetase family protein [Clostridia bacterium]
MKTLKEYAQIVNERLENIFPVAEENSFAEGEMPELLARSMRYSLLAGGKRLRPSMLLAAVDMLGGDTAKALDFACAVEMIHSYSLIHDDLPGMDNDVLRRGMPTNHVVFGVGQAILAGDGLLNAAFEVMLAAALKDGANSRRYLEAVNEIAVGAGTSGMIGGQVMDLYCERNAVEDEKALSFVQRGKTACMFIYPLRAAGRLAGANEEEIDALSRYGEAFGRVFQATDDLLDVVGDSEEVGKTLGKDAEQGKLTMVSLYGVDKTREFVNAELKKALDALKVFGDKSAFFRDLICSMVDRTK